MLHTRILTLFPELFPGPLGASVTGRALEEGAWACDIYPIRDYAADRHKTVDDTPYGGGPGMVMRADVLGMAADAALEGFDGARRIYLSPRGRVFDQALAAELAASERLLLLCGRFEGVDQRFLDAYGFEEISIGDYVLTGGELAAYVLLDAAVRLLPGVLGEAESLSEESFCGREEFTGLLEYPQYTKPPLWKEREVPAVLRSGHHGEVRKWRLSQAEALTQQRRPDLWRRLRNRDES